MNEYLPIYENNREGSVAERRAHLAMIERFFHLPSRPKLLDVGCALGFMLREARAAGWEAIGIETSTFAARYAAQYSSCEVHTGTLQRAGFESSSFDVVTLMDVIEHIAQPRDLIDEIHRLLRPKGVLFIVTPNFASLFARIFGSNAYGIGPDEHITYFEPSTLIKLLRASGFERIISFTKDIYAENLRRLLHRRNNGGAAIKTAFSRNILLDNLRGIANRIFMRVPLGDKLICLAQK